MPRKIATMTIRRARSPRRRCRIALCLAAVAPSALMAGDTIYYQGPDGGNWNSSADGQFNWFNATTPAGWNFPNDGADAQLLQSGSNGAANLTVVFNHNYSGTGLSSWNIDSGNTLTQSADSTAMVAGTAFIGLNGFGTYNQSAGSNTINGWLCLGWMRGSSGSYTLSDGTLIENNVEESIGFNGNGSFRQSGGVHSARALVIGSNAGSSGTYTLSGTGVLNAGGELVGGDDGPAIFNQSGGSQNVAGGLTIGGFGGGRGVPAFNVYTLSDDATLRVIGEETVGYFVPGGGTNYGGTFIQLGGTHVIGGTSGGTLWIGRDVNGSGSYTLNAGTLSMGVAYIGNAGVGVLVQNGGSISANTEYIGYAGRGTFIQSGGTNYVGWISIGDQLHGSGTMILSGGILRTNGETVGYQGIGTFTQTGGSNSTEGLGIYNGTMTLSGGTLDAFNTMLQPGVLVSSGGTLNQTGGTLAAESIRIDPNGLWSMGGGTMSISPRFFVYSPPCKIYGVFSQTGGTVAVSGAVDAYSGRLNLQGGLFTADSIQFTSGGVFTQTGGSANFSGTSGMTVDSGSSYALADGTLSVTAAEYFGYQTTGTYSQTGGTNLANWVYFGYGASASGSGTLSGGTLNAQGVESIGYNSTGSFTQSGGINSTGRLRVGMKGSFTLSGGTLSAAGSFNNGIFNQTGGVSNLGALTGAGSLTVGNGAGAATANVTSFAQKSVTIGNEI